jgi:hypothetical protein
MGNYTRKFIGFFLATFLFSISYVTAQAPLGFNYQGVALTNAGTPVSSKKISLRIGLIELQQLGAIKYQEIHNVNTDAYGQFSVIIGNGQAITGKMVDVQWSKFPYYMKVELDLDGGSAFVFVGTSQLLSVPYALYANNAGAASISVDSLKLDIATIKLTQKGDSIVLNNNRGAIYIPKIDSLSRIVAQFAGIKSGVIKYIRDSATKTPYGLAIGYDALKGMDTLAANANNYAIGNGAGSSLLKNKDNSSNNDNIFIGTASGANLGTTASGGAMQNVIIGNNAGQNAKADATGNVLVGYEAGKNSVGSVGSKTVQYSQNVALGTSALQSAKNAGTNVSIGANNLKLANDVSRNVSIGANTALSYNGDDNVILGTEMLYDTSSNGSKNVIIGASVATNLRGSGNVILGYKAASDSIFLNTSNRLIIANDKTKTPLIYGEFDNKKVTINGDLTVTGKLNGANGGGTSIADSKGNIIVGTSTLSSNKAGTNNIAIGDNALNKLDSGSNNIAIGLNALKSSPKLGSLIAIGENSLSNVTTGFANTAIGGNSLASTTSGDRNTGVGASSLINNTTGSYNTAVGVEALGNNISGYRNTAIGMVSLATSKSASNNTAVGFYSQKDNISGGANTSLGDQSLTYNTSGSNNTSIGWGSLDQNKTGSSNTALGYNAGTLIDSGSNNVFIGSNAGNDSSFIKANNKLVIANSGTKTPLIYGDFANRKLKFNADIDNLLILNRINFTDENANDHINKYDTGYNSALIYARYFYGHYGDLVIQGQSKTYTGNIHFVTGSNIPGYDPPTQRMVIMDNGNVGIGNFAPFNPPTSKLQVTGNVLATGYKTPTGTSSQYLMADGSVSSGTTTSTVIPYTGATQSVDLGAYDMKVNGISIGVGSGIASATSTNVLIGKNALINNTDGYWNTAIGYESLKENTTGGSNTSIGSSSLSKNTTGASNTATGSAALLNNTTGSQNTAIGRNTLLNNTSGNQNTAIGAASLYSNTTGTSNTATGQFALFSNTTGTNNTAIGQNALSKNTTGNFNTALSSSVLSSNTEGGANVAIGNSALIFNTLGNDNTAVGNVAIGNNIDGDGNTAIGRNALDDIRTGNNNTAVGKYSGTLGDLSNTVAIGYNATATASNTIQLGDNNITDVKTSGVITSRGLGIGTKSNTSAALEVNSSSQGFLPPRMTAAQRDNIVTPVAGLVVWCSNCADFGELQVYNGSIWTNMIGGAVSLVPSSSPPPIAVEASIVFSIDIDPGVSNILAVVGATQAMGVNISSTIPTAGVNLDVIVRKDSDNSIVFSSSISSTTSVNNITISGLTAGVLCTASVSVTSKSSSANTLTKTFKLARK